MLLRLKFTGLCLFVRDPRNPCVHVLFPSTAEHGAHGVPEHVLKVGGTIIPHRWFMDLSGAGATGQKNRLGSYAFPASELITRKVNARQYGMEPDREVIGRITLPWADQVDPGSTAEWEVGAGRGARSLTLTHEFSWGIENAKVNGDNWKFRKLKGAVGTAPSLAVPNGAVSEVHITHLPSGDGDKPDVGYEAKHVIAYYAVHGTTDGPHPVLKQKPAFAGSSKGFDGGSPYNCMIGEGEPLP